MKLDWSHWLYSLGKCVIGGMAATGSAWFGSLMGHEVMPATVDKIPLSALPFLLLTSSLANLFFFLKTSPLPPDEDEAAPGGAASPPSTTNTTTMKTSVSLLIGLALLAGVTLSAQPLYQPQPELFTEPAAVLLDHAQPLEAQAVIITNSPWAEVWDHLTTGSNYWVAGYGSIAPKDAKASGGGFAIGYQGMDMLNPVLRGDVVGRDFWMVSLTAQVSPPKSVMGKWPVIPFALSGAGIDFSDGQRAAAIIGIGAAARLGFIGQAWFWQHSDLVFSYEQWYGVPSAQREQVRFGYLLRL